MSIGQRRRWERYRVRLSAEVTNGRTAPAACSTLDVCEGGLGLLCAAALEVGGEYRVLVPDLSTDAIAGTVRWCTPGGGEFHVGLELTTLSAKQSSEIRNAVDRWKSEDAPDGDA